MQTIHKVYIAVYAIVLLMIVRKYIKIKNHPEQYDSMDAIYAYDPRFQYVKGGELAKVARETGYANILVVLSAIPLVVLNCVIYYFVRKNYFPPESEHLIPEAANIYLLAIMSGPFFAFVMFCFFGHCRSGFLQALSLNSLISGRGEKFTRSGALRNHLVVFGVIFAIVFPVYFLYTFNYTYMTEEKIVNNSCFSLHEDMYRMDECPVMVLRYRKNGKENVKDRNIKTQLNIVGKDGKQLVLGCANFMPNWSIDCSEGMIGLVAEKMLEHGVQLIKPDMTEEEFYSVLNWNGEDFLQFYYPELCEQYSISQEE